MNPEGKNIVGFLEQYIIELLDLELNVFCKLKFLTFANIFPQAPVGNFFVNYNESARHFVLF